MPRPTLRARTRRLALAAAVAGALLLPITTLVVAPPAMAGGSDAPTPYTVSASGVTLPAGQTFRANGHVNAQVIPLSQYTPGETYRARGADWTPMQITRHFDPNNDQPGGAYIGQSYYPFSGAQQQLPADGYCVVWVQVDGFDEHFGEGGQDPICTTPPAAEEPTPSEPAPSEPAPSEPAVVSPQIQDYVGACDAAFVLDNGSSTVDVTYTINGVDYLVRAGTGIHTDADGTRIAPVDGQYVITTDTGRSWTFPARACVVSPQIQDYVGACDAAFVLDNGSSTVDVTYTINGVDYLVRAGTGIHTDADGTRIAPVDGQYVITTDTGRSWTFPARACPASTPPASPAPSEPTPSEPTPSEPTPSNPTPSEPAPSEPVPSEPVPSEPVPSEPTPSEPTPSEPTPSEPAPSEPAPSEPAPSEPTPSEPTPSEPAPSEPGVDVPAVDPPTEPAPSQQPPATEVPATGGETQEGDTPAAETPSEVGTPAASEQSPTAVAVPATAQPSPTQAATTASATLPRTGAEPLLLVLLLGGALLTLGAVVRLACR